MDRIKYCSHVLARYFLAIANTMRPFVALFLLACTLGAAQASRTLQAPSYPTISDALAAAANANLTTLLAALKVSVQDVVERKPPTANPPDL